MGKEGFVEDRRRFDREEKPIRRDGEDPKTEERDPENPENINVQGEIINILGEIKNAEAHMAQLAATLNSAVDHLNVLYESLPPQEQRAVLQRLGVKDVTELQTKRKIGFRPEESKAPGNRLGHIGF
ncbi:MAG: hypothetical protein V1856_00900 [Candidatus Liptonbacteria bacterium]